jgi:hypothetical protein
MAVAPNGHEDILEQVFDVIEGHSTPGEQGAQAQGGFGGEAREAVFRVKVGAREVLPAPNAEARRRLRAMRAQTGGASAVMAGLSFRGVFHGAASPTSLDPIPSGN